MRESMGSTDNMRVISVYQDLGAPSIGDNAHISVSCHRNQCTSADINRRLTHVDAW